MRIAAEVMTRNVLSVRADWSVTELATFLCDHSISGAPVVSGEGKPLGVVSLTDIVRDSVAGDASIRSGATAEPHVFYQDALERVVAREEAAGFRIVQDSQTTVRDIMTPMIFSVRANARIDEVADAMVRGHIHRIFVMEDGRIVGVISSLDMLALIRDGAAD
jgi:CBS domain-containing protein